MHLIAGMGNDDDPIVLMQRALRLTSLALRLKTTGAVFLFLKAGSDTWVGPTPTRCLDELTQASRSIVRASDDLIAAARKLEKQAELILGAGGGGGARVLHQ
jgi:hypothetical protein